MTEPNPFEPFFAEIRKIIREEIRAANNGNQKMLTAEQLAEALQVNKATVYGWVKTKSIPYFESGRHLRFNFQEVLEHQRKKPNNSWLRNLLALTSRVKGGLMEKKVKEYLREIGAKGGKASGKAKVRGDSDYYRQLQRISARKKKEGKK
jgi:excisionase family DNA binding protein